jgi:hypothetical protein
MPTTRHCIAALSLLLTACTPTAYLSLKPDQGSGFWKDGHERSVIRQDSLEVSLGFVRYEGNSLVFDLDIQNQSERAVLVAPEQFNYTPVATTLHKGQQYMPYFPGAVKAINPEQKLDGLVAAVVYNVRESQQALLLTGVEFGQQHRLEHSAAALQAQTQKQDVEARLLRKNTLLPGQGIRGYVYFPRTDEADVLRLSLPLRRQPLLLSYRQLRSRQPAY